jgi:DNA-directed RNA polymerase beta subunit
MKPPEEPLAPEGVKLFDPMDFTTLRGNIFDSIESSVKSSFPQSYGGVRMEVEDLHYADPEEYDLATQKKALMSDKFLSRRLRGTVRLMDEKTGEQLDEKKITLLRAPYLTERGTFIHNGSEYTNVAQSRLIPGVYTRVQNNGQLEVQVNTRPGSGNAFRMGFEPDTAQYRLKVRGSNLHLYSVLHDMGVPDEELEKRWGKDILDLNKARYDKRSFGKAYEKMVPKFMREDGADATRQAELVKEALNRAMVHEKVVRRNLPNMLDHTKSASWRNQWEAKKLAQTVIDQELDAMPFDPDYTPPEVIKNASDEFAPDLSGEEMQDAYDQLFNPDKPRLASMEHWPEKWIPPGTDPKGWVSWYIDYTNGKRTPDDDRQIKRWKSFKARHGSQFKKNPTPRRAFALRNWAINPENFFEEESEKEKIREMMDTYRYKQELKYNLIKSGSTHKGVRTLGTLLHTSGQIELDPSEPTDIIYERLLQYCETE